MGSGHINIFKNSHAEERAGNLMGAGKPPVTAIAGRKCGYIYRLVNIHMSHH